MGLWLVVRSGPDKGRAVELTGEVVVLGRQRGCDLIVRDERASRRHVELKRIGDGIYRLCDLGSANGTYVDGTRATDVELKGGEEIRIGNVRIDVTRKAPDGMVRPPSTGRPDPLSATTRAESRARIPTYSMVGRMIDAGTRRARRIALIAGALAVATVVTLVALLATGTLGGGEGAVPKVVSAVAPSTALVETLQGATRTGTGSGWVLDAREGLIVTNAHVVNQGDGFRAVVAGKSRSARIAGVAPCEDLAVLRVADTQGLRAARVGTGASVEQGETVVALGFGAEAQPGDQVGSTRGVVSVPSTAFRDPAADVPPYDDVVQTDTALNPGNSGGPLVDLDSRVIGVNSAARTSGADGRPLQNVNYAIGIDRARRVLAELSAGRSVGWTGLTFGFPSDADLVEAGLPPGLRITGVAPGTPAADAGLGPASGLLAGINGRAIANTMSSYCDAARDLRSGDRVTLAFAAPKRKTTRDVEITLP